MDVYETFHIPKPLARVVCDLSTMEAIITSYPPLGQVTLINERTIAFTILLETDHSRASNAWEVSLWHSYGERWQESQLKPLSGSPSNLFSTIQASTGSVLHRICFRADLEISSPMAFTIKFRSGSDQTWKWVKDHQGSLDGTILSKPEIPISQSENLSDYVKDLNQILETRKVISQSPGTTVWFITAPVDAANGEESAIVNLKFGLPWAGKILRWFALARIWAPWLVPQHGKSRFELEKEAIACSFMEPGGRHLVILAISGVEDVRTQLKSDESGAVIVNIRNDRDKIGTLRIVAAVGNDFESANAAAVYHARLVVHNDERATGEEQKELQAAKDGVKAEWMENWFDGLTYCTWNGLGQRLTDEKIYKAVDTLASKNINITNLIIDDNWQSIDYRGEGQFQYGWIEFEADRKAFPNGLKHTVSKIREKHKHIKHIAVWHAMLGYWAGIAPDGEIAKTYKTTEVVREESLRRHLPMGGKMTVVAKEDTLRMYDDFYSFLSNCGVDAVKTDAQFMLDTLKSAKDRCDLTTTYLDAWTISSLKHFSIKAISCMSQIPQILFHSQLPQNKPAILVRNSDDFFPEVEASHAWHVFTNAHNSLFTQHLNLLPDWDMFQTVHDYSGFHAAARCVSGGPIYFTDVPGKHDVGLINQMTGQTTTRKTVIFRPNVGKSLDAYVGYEDEVLLKVGTYHGMAITGTSFIGIFNISQRPLTELLSLSRFLGVIEAQYYIVRSHVSGLITSPMQVIDPTSLIYLNLGIRGYDILSAYPLRGFLSGSNGKEETTWIANLGLLGKMTGAAAIVRNDMSVRDNGTITIDTSLKALGVLGIYVSNLPQYSLLSRFIMTIFNEVIPSHTVSVSKSDPKVLEVDVETAWKEMNLDSGWSNEVEVKIHLNAVKS